MPAPPSSSDGSEEGAWPCAKLPSIILRRGSASMCGQYRRGIGRACRRMVAPPVCTSRAQRWDAESPVSLGLSCLNPSKNGKGMFLCEPQKSRGCHGGGAGCDLCQSWRKSKWESGAKPGFPSWLAECYWAPTSPEEHIPQPQVWGRHDSQTGER